MRTVRDNVGATWICLELPEVPADQVAQAATMPADTVAVECNSGAARVIALLAPGWDESLTDDALAAAIRSAGAL
ncbi:MAG: hypothetical protein LCH84_11865 [Gemmatimonadetes bacterium]|nr:hypothetical protein [Gemmatimonadota bacterium]